MRIIVTGGRGYADFQHVYSILAYFRAEKPVIVHGAAPGADTLADRAAVVLRYPTEPHPADWTAHNRRAGFVRNEVMAQLGADLCIAFPGGRGTADMIDRAQRHDIPVIEALPLDVYHAKQDY